MNEQRGFTLWFTGLSGSGKTTISEIVEHELRERERRVEVLDGDIVRTNLSKGLTFSRDDRNINVLRIGFVANLLTRNGVGVIVSAISPYKEARDQVRRRIVDFVEVFVDAPLEVCAERDVKGLYEKAFAGEIEQFTGVSDPYEPPNAPDLVLKTDEETPEESARKVIEKLEFFGYLWPREAEETEYNWSSGGEWQGKGLPNAALVSTLRLRLSAFQLFGNGGRILVNSAVRG
jgi:adenylylsulfate kinase